MKNKKVIRLFTAMLTVVLCMTAFSVTAFVGGGDGDYYTGGARRDDPRAHRGTCHRRHGARELSPYHGGQCHAGG